MTAGVDSAGPPARRRRSVHFVPGGNERFIEKALASNADTLVLDLEDSIPPEQKTSARDAVVEWLQSGAVRSVDKEIMVRINAADTPWWRDDVEQVAAHAPDSLMVPKVISPGQLDAVADAVATVQPADVTTLFPVATETPSAALHVEQIARHRRVDGVCWGAEDLSAALGAATSRDAGGRFLPVFETVRSLCLLGAAAGGVAAIDAVWTDLGDLDGLRAEAAGAAAMGFAGKITVHPDQVDIVNEAFSPTAEELAASTELLIAYDDHRRSGSGAFRHRGQMVDAPHISRARAVLRRAAAASEEAS